MKSKMLYRAVGATGMSASVVGLGAEHLDHKPYAVVEETIHAALECGINIIDLFMPGDEVRTNIGKALGKNRDQVLIQGHVGSIDENGQYGISRDPAVCVKNFEDLLRRLGTDYIDFGMLFFMDSDEDFRKVKDNGIVDYLLKLKESGVVRAIGASSHNAEVARQVVESGIVDMLMFSINPAFDMSPGRMAIEDLLDKGMKEHRPNQGLDPAREALYKLCEQRGVGITVMKSLGAGKLLSPDHTPFGKPLTVGQCIHYALTRPAVVSALVGCQSREQMLEAVGYLDLTDGERDYTEVVSDYQNNFKGSCVYCNHCLPCPSAIDIAAVNKYRDIAVLDREHVPPSVAQHYRSLSSHGSDCIACGSCEARCPFSVEIIANMRDAATIFGV